MRACSDSFGTSGGIHQTGCGNHWFKDTEGVQSYLKAAERNDYDSDLLEERYCYGGSSMYMQGFEWESSTCVVFLFAPWVVSTRAALIAACFGTVAMGIVVELIIRQRKRVLQGFENGTKKVAYAALLYGLQLTTSYVVMLIIMTYSGPLFFSVIIGLVGGHVYCNWKEMTRGKKSSLASLEGSTPCCQNVVDASSTDKPHNIDTKFVQSEGLTTRDSSCDNC